MAQQISEVIVRYAETDAQGVVHHATYPVWFEEGRSDFLRKIGVPYSDWEQQGYFVVVVDLNTRYLAPAFYEDRLQVVTRLERIKKRLMEFSYQVFNQHQQLLAQGSTRHLIVDADKQPCALNGEFYQQLCSKLEQQQEAGND
ncbi:MAG: acyl-CoA thioesterase [Desulfuromonas sp.]|nr:acyl-CoA thioesterase [Desulfuromonas sp.]